MKIHIIRIHQKTDFVQEQKPKNWTRQSQITRKGKSTMALKQML